MALVVPCAHGGFSFMWPWRVHSGRNHLPLHGSTPERQSLFESHRQRRWLTYWSSLWMHALLTGRRARLGAGSPGTLLVSCARGLSSLCGAQPLVKQGPQHIGTAHPQVGLGRLHLGGVGIQTAEQLFRHPQGEDVHALVTPRVLGTSPSGCRPGWRLCSHCLLLLGSSPQRPRC